MFHSTIKPNIFQYAFVHVQVFSYIDFKPHRLIRENEFNWQLKSCVLHHVGDVRTKVETTEVIPSYITTDCQYKYSYLSLDEHLLTQPPITYTN